MNEITKAGAKPIVSPETGLTSLQERCALLLASGTRITEIAAELPVCKTTLYKWLRSDLFRCYLNLMKKDLQNGIQGRVLGLKEKALDALGASLESVNEQVRLKAATWIIDKLTLQEVGETDARQLLKSQAEGEMSNNWQSAETADAYRKKLQESGLEE